MPIYEFYCPGHNKIYSFFAKSAAQGRLVPRCPDDPKHQMVKMFSRFSIGGRTGSAGEASESPDEAADETRLNAAMQELERDMAGMDEQNPDPRQMGHLMRKMAGLTGEKMDGEMEEMVQRLESGEDPEKLEEKFGDMDDAGPEGDSAQGLETSPPDSRRTRRAQPPTRDPELYDFEDFI